MLAHVGPDRRERLARMFDPSYPLPSSLTDITLHARAHTPTPRKGQSFIIDDFENVTGVSSRGFNNAWGGLTMLANGGAGRGHDPVQRVAEIAWAAPGGFLQLNATAPGTRRDVSGYEALQLRVTPRCVMLACPFVSNADGDLNLSVALVTGKGRLSKAVPIKKFAAIRRPVSGFIDIELLQTVRIPLAAFEGADLKKFRGVRILFDKSSTGHIYLANVRLDRKEAGPGGQTRAMEERAAVAGSGVEIPVMAGEHRIVATRRIGRGRNAPVEIEFSSTARFPVGASLPELTIGQERFRLSQFPGGALDRIVFRLSAAEFARVRDGAPVQIRLGGRGIWNFGSYQRQ
jgi:hypothetical protein